MKIIAIEKSRTTHATSLAAHLHASNVNRHHTVWFEFDGIPEPYLASHADPFLPTLQVPCSLAGEPLDVKAPVSEQLYHQLQKPMSIQACWFEEMQEIPVTADRLVERQKCATPRSFSFFSGGVDSFYTIFKRLKHSHQEPKLTHLVMMEGFENPLSEERSRESKSLVVREAAEALQLTPILGRSNVRDVFPQANWGAHYHGACLAAVALCLSPGISTAYVPSSCSWSTLFPWGSHPLLEPNWANESTTIIHHGCEAGRARKIRFCVEHDPRFLQFLHVCLGKGNGSRNCGNCIKCLRTCITLAILGQLHRAVTFDNPLPKGFQQTYLRKVFRKPPTVIRAEMDFVMENLRLSRELGIPDQNLHRFLERFLSRCRWRLLQTEFHQLLFSKS